MVKDGKAITVQLNNARKNVLKGVIVMRKEYAFAIHHILEKTVVKFVVLHQSAIIMECATMTRDHAIALLVIILRIAHESSAQNQ